MTTTIDKFSKRENIAALLFLLPYSIVFLLFRVYPIVSGFLGLVFVTLSLVTLLPADASKPNLLGYYSLYSWVPNSTAILFSLALVTFLFALRIKSRYSRESMFTKPFHQVQSIDEYS